MIDYLNEQKKLNEKPSGILKATFILGSSSVIEMVLTIVRTKVLAIFLGPSGVGTAGLLNNLMVTIGILFSLGTGTSATRSVAEAYSTGNSQSVGQIKTVLTILAVVLGVAGCLAVFFSAEQLAEYTLGESDNAYQIKILALGVFFTIASGAQMAFLNGLRRIGDMARVTLIGSFLGSIIAIALSWKFRNEGIVYYVIAVPLLSFLISACYIIRFKIPYPVTSTETFKKQAALMLKFGVPMMLSGLINNGVMLIVRGRIANTLGLEAVGLFQVAWAISGVYIGFVFTAMVREYYPRITGIIDDHDEVNIAVNDQAKLAIWLTTPLLLGIIAFAPLMIHILYSNEFLPIAATLRWMALGTVLKVVTWSMGIVWVARGSGRYALADAILWGLFFVAGIFAGLKYTGIEGVGWVYTASFLFAIAYTRFFVGRITGFQFQRAVLFETFLLFFTCLVCILLNYWFTTFIATVVSGLICALLSIRAAYFLYQSYAIRNDG